MNWRKLRIKAKKKIVRNGFTFFLLVLSGCGVKGDPLPPERPAQLGRGRPTYKKATVGLKYNPEQGKVDQEDEEDKDDKEEPDGR